MVHFRKGLPLSLGGEKIRGDWELTLDRFSCVCVYGVVLGEKMVYIFSFLFFFYIFQINWFGNFLIIT